MPHRSVWKPVTRRDTSSRSLVQHRHQADEIGVRAYARRLGIKPGTLSRYLTGGWEPKAADIRARLGLPALGLGAICPVHGRVCAVKHRPPAPDKPKRKRPGWMQKPLNVIYEENTLDW